MICVGSVSRCCILIFTHAHTTILYEDLKEPTKVMEMKRFNKNIRTIEIFMIAFVHRKKNDRWWRRRNIPTCAQEG